MAKQPTIKKQATIKKQEPLTITIQVPPDGVVLKMLNGTGYAIGTTHLTKTGLAFKKPKSKAAAKEISWATLHKLIETGLL